jgi:ABC-type proline/glycine betaine transport system ATPase subunit
MFKHFTNTIAIIDSDRIMVLDSGELKEFDTPKVLLNDTSSRFYSLVRQTGKSNMRYLLKIANGEISYSTELQNQLMKKNMQ